MKIVRVIGYVAAFVLILLAVSFGVSAAITALNVAWPPLLERAVVVILTWCVFWVAVWRPMGRRMDRRASGQASR